MNGAFRLVALHGFLGRASDWDALAGVFPDAAFSALDLWSILDCAEAATWASVGGALDKALVQAAGGAAEPVFVVGYSFGARLALASRVLAEPGSPVRGCCFVSCNPGLPEEDEQAREARRASDAAWAERILEWPERKLWREWDAQPVFQGSRPRSPRPDLPARRTLLARVLRQLSLGAQPDFTPRLHRWPSPMLWVTGGLDTKFSAIARELTADNVPASFVSCKRAGHRVPWDVPEEFAQAVRSWMAQVMERSR